MGGAGVGNRVAFKQFKSAKEGEKKKSSKLLYCCFLSDTVLLETFILVNSIEHTCWEDLHPYC